MSACRWRPGSPWLIALVLAAWWVAAPAHGDVRIKVSVKLLYNDLYNPPIPPGGDVNGDGAIDPGHCSAVNFNASAISCAAEIVEKFEYVNRVMGDLGRGYTFVVEEIADLTDPPPISANLGAATWTLASPGSLTEDSLTSRALRDTAGFKWRTNMLNVYVFDADGGGYSDNLVTGTTNRVSTTSQGIGGSWPRFFHELGHNLGLFHTHGTASSDCDGVCDTEADVDSLDALDEQAMNLYGTTFANLTCEQQQKVFDLMFNIMAYHGDNGNPYDCRAFVFDSVRCGITNKVGMCRYRLTPDQLDRITNRLNNLHTIGVVSGRTVFVNRNYNPCTYAPGSPACGPCPCDQAPRDVSGNPVNPYVTVADALGQTGTDSNQDVVLIRGGSYNEQLTISQPVQLRGTRGAVKIGRP